MAAMDRRGCKALAFRDFRTAGPHHRVRGRQQPVDQIDVVVNVGIGDDTVLRPGQKAEQRTIATRSVRRHPRPTMNAVDHLLAARL